MLIESVAKSLFYDKKNDKKTIKNKKLIKNQQPIKF